VTGEAPASFSSLRLLADDMTGALDSASAFVAVFGEMCVSGALSSAATQVVDSATREVETEKAAAHAAMLAPLLAAAPGRLSFFKVDSLLRGNSGAELAAILKRAAFDRVVIANAMPFQGRKTRHGRQVRLKDGVETPTGENLPGTLTRYGVSLRLAQPAQVPGPGVTLYDSETEADLDTIVRNTLAAGGATLWVGSGGLAGALARALTRQPVAMPRLHAPVLGLIGSQHRMMLAQMARVPGHVVSLADATVETAASVTRDLAQAHAAFLICDLPAGITRPEAHARIEARFSALVTQVPPPGVLFVSGGETLRSLMLPLEAEALDVIGEIEPGAPISRLRGGLWHGTLVLSKSGAFGQEDFLQRLLSLLHVPSKAEIA
jgi:uncharacterized protein YgbK (DUF1537 family)